MNFPLLDCVVSDLQFNGHYNKNSRLSLVFPFTHNYEFIPYL